MNKQEAKKRLLDELDHIDVGPTAYANLKIAIGRMFNAIEDHPKVKLPREVGEELDKVVAYWKLKGDRFPIDTIIGNLYACHGRQHHPYLSYWWDETDNASAILADAYRYGWEAEPEAKWYVQAPKEWCPEFAFWICKDGSKVYPTLQEYMDYPEFNQQFQFTRAELKKYHLDSDIFTLVPVENEEVSR